jgi:hypothetical protein
MKIEFFLDNYDTIERSEFVEKIPRTLIIIDKMKISIPLIPDERIHKFIKTVQSGQTEISYPNESEQDKVDDEYTPALFSSGKNGNSYFGWDINSFSIRTIQRKCYLTIKIFIQHCEEHFDCDKSCKQNHSVLENSIEIDNNDLIQALQKYLNEKPKYKYE